MGIDKKRFDFIRSKGPEVQKALQGFGKLFKSGHMDSPYNIDWGEVLRLYDERGIGDVCEFASSYAFGWHAMHGLLDNDSSKQAMYLEIIEKIKELRKNVI